MVTQCVGDLKLRSRGLVNGGGEGTRRKRWRGTYRWSTKGERHCKTRDGGMRKYRGVMQIEAR